MSGDERPGYVTCSKGHARQIGRPCPVCDEPYGPDRPRPSSPPPSGRITIWVHPNLKFWCETSDPKAIEQAKNADITLPGHFCLISTNNKVIVRHDKILAVEITEIPT